MGAPPPHRRGPCIAKRAPVRFAALFASLVSAPTIATACPTGAPTQVTTDATPATNSPCIYDVDFTHSSRAVEVGYALGGAGTSQTGIGQTATAFAGLDLGYAMQFGSDPDQPSYEIELSGGVSAQRSAGDVAATGLVTRGEARLGPAQVTEAVIDDGRTNFAFFPFTMELAHTGELAARPRLAARPELARALYNRERIAVSTRLIRAEGAGEKAQTTAPGATLPKKPTSWALDFLTLHGDLDIAAQSATRTEAGIGGALLGVTEHTTHASMDVFGIDHRHVAFATGEATSFDTLWMFRFQGVNPDTGTQYYIGWGDVIAMPDRDVLARKIDPENGDVTIGGLGWFAKRWWGGYGAQYKREPFATMTGEVALEDRVSGELFFPRPLPVTARAFWARTTRLVEDELRHSTTAGVQLDTSYARGGFVSTLALECGRTFYTVLDDTMPQSTGFAASAGLTVQHSGRRTWVR